MKILVCGGRNYADKECVYRVLDRLHAARSIAVLIHGGCTGADALAEEWADLSDVPVAGVPARWNRWGVVAGPRRNEAMVLLKPDGVVAFPGGAGTNDMVRRAKEAGIKVWKISDASPQD